MFAALGRATAVDPAVIEREWLDLAVIDNQVVEIVAALQPHMAVGLLTNSPAAFVRTILRKHNLKHLFDAIVVSSEVGSAKPDGAIYNIALRQLDTNAVDSLFIDDNPTNVVAAERIGMGALLFRSAAQLKSALVG